VTRSLPATAQALLSLPAVGLVTVGYRWLAPVNPTTVALTYVLWIVIVATWWGINAATMTAIAAMVCFNVFFLPPVGTLTIADPQNWISFVAFMATAVIVSQVSGRARRRQLEAIERQRDLERLYAMSRFLLLAEPDESLPGLFVRRLAEIFGLTAVALYDRRADGVSWGGAVDRGDTESRLREVARTAEVVHEPGGLVIAPIRLGGAPIGSLALGGAVLGDAMLQSIANLAAIGLERWQNQEAVARAEADRRSGELRSALLDAVAHEFKTPLTAGKAAASALLAGVSDASADGELIAIVNEALDRLEGLVSDAIHMLRIDAGDLTVTRGRHRVADLVAQTTRDMGGRLEGHVVEVTVPPDLVVDADASLIRLALRQLLDNAVKYSPPDATIEVMAAADGDVHLTIRNSGPAIPASERARLFDRFYRGGRAANIPGSGLGLAIVQRVARAHGGDVTLTSSPEAGTAFTMLLPAPAPAERPRA
jgi:two-component system, OmpR family, sensor histidine kinase KdpD